MSTSDQINALRLKVQLCLDYEKPLTPLSLLRLAWLARELAERPERLLRQSPDLLDPSLVVSQAWLREAWGRTTSKNALFGHLDLTTANSEPQT